jgi:hypothetical protein
MLQNVKITSDEIIFSLFGFTPSTVSSVFAKNSDVFIECQEVQLKKGWGNKYRPIESGSCPEAGTGPRAFSGSRATLIRGIK